MKGTRLVVERIARPGEKRHRVPTQREGGAHESSEVSGVLDAVQREQARHVGGAERGRAVEIRRGELGDGVDPIDGLEPRGFFEDVLRGADDATRGDAARHGRVVGEEHHLDLGEGRAVGGAVDLLEETRAGDDDGAGLLAVGAILDELREVLHRGVVRAGDALGGVAARRARARARAHVAAGRALRSRRDDRGPRRARVRRAGSSYVASTAAADAPSGGSAGRDAPRGARVRRARRAPDGGAPSEHALRHHSEPHPPRSRARECPAAPRRCYFTCNSGS